MIAQMRDKVINQMKHSVKYCTAVSPNTKTTSRTPKLSKLTIPKLPKEQIQALKYVTGLHMGTSGISWALLNVENENRHHLLEWNNFPFPKNTQKLHIYDLCKVIFEVQKSLPQSDIYVIETLNPPLRSHTNPVQLGVLELISQLQSMLCVALSQTGSNLTDCPRLVFLKNRLTARVFNLLIKSECITARHIIENIIASQILSDAEYYEAENRSSTNSPDRQNRTSERNEAIRSVLDSYEQKLSLTENNEKTRSSTDFHHQLDRTSTERNGKVPLGTSFREEQKRTLKEKNEAIRSVSDSYEQKRSLTEPHEHDSVLNFHTRLVMSEELVSVYDASKGYTAESLAIALLHAICFTDVIVKPRASVLDRLLVNSGS